MFLFRCKRLKWLKNGGEIRIDPKIPGGIPQVALAVGMVTLIGILDFHTEPELSLALLYLVPIFQATWFSGRSAGILMACLSVGSILTVSLTAPANHWLS